MMTGERYLLDSNIVIYHATDKRLLTAEVLDILKDTDNSIRVPSKCVEELIHLQQSGRINVKIWKSAIDIVWYITREMHWWINYVEELHLKTLARLQLFPDHRDPTDRIIIAQAIAEGMFMISSDRKFHDYRPLGLNLVFNKR